MPSLVLIIGMVMLVGLVLALIPIAFMLAASDGASGQAAGLAGQNGHHVSPSLSQFASSHICPDTMFFSRSAVFPKASGHATRRRL